MKRVGAINKTFDGCLVDALDGSAEVLFGALCGDGSVSSSVQRCTVVSEPLLRIVSANVEQLAQYAATMRRIVGARDEGTVEQSRLERPPAVHKSRNQHRTDAGERVDGVHVVQVRPTRHLRRASTGTSVPMRADVNGATLVSELRGML